MKKNLPFHDVLYHVVLLYFSTVRQVAFALHNRKLQERYGNSMSPRIRQHITKTEDEEEI